MTDDTDSPAAATSPGGAASPDDATSPDGATTLVLTALEARILGVLVEKQLTVPDTYPLSLNALKAGCNQKNNRDPVMTVSEAEIAAALDDLRGRTLIIESSGSRTLRYEQNLRRVLDIAGAAVPLIAVLMLRGPQTAAELRLNAERMQRFADASSVEAFLRKLADHSSGPLVTELPRRSGERERRWMHRLVPDDSRLAGADLWPAGDGRATAPAGGGPAGAASATAADRTAGAVRASAAVMPAAPADPTIIADLQSRLATLEASVERLQQQLAHLLDQTGQPPRWG